MTQSRPRPPKGAFRPQSLFRDFIAAGIERDRVTPFMRDSSYAPSIVVPAGRARSSRGGYGRRRQAAPAARRSRREQPTMPATPLTVAQEDQRVETPPRPNHADIPNSQRGLHQHFGDDIISAGPSNLSERARGKQPVRDAAPDLGNELQHFVDLTLSHPNGGDLFSGLLPAAIIARFGTFRKYALPQDNPAVILYAREFVDFDRQTVREMFVFIYSGRLPDWNQEGPKLGACLDLLALGQALGVHGLPEAVADQILFHQNEIDDLASLIFARDVYEQNELGEFKYELAEGDLLQNLVKDLLRPHLNRLVSSGQYRRIPETQKALLALIGGLFAQRDQPI